MPIRHVFTYIQILVCQDINLDKCSAISFITVEKWYNHINLELPKIGEHFKKVAIVIVGVGGNSENNDVISSSWLISMRNGFILYTL